jgi:hypothetical protein
VDILCGHANLRVQRADIMDAGGVAVSFKNGTEDTDWQALMSERKVAEIWHNTTTDLSRQFEVRHALADVTGYGATVEAALADMRAGMTETALPRWMNGLSDNRED